jgi:hypothetical protein
MQQWNVKRFGESIKQALILEEKWLVFVIYVGIKGILGMIVN